MNTITIELGETTRKLLERIDNTLTELLRETRINSDTLELIRLAVTNAGTPFPAVPEQPQAAPEPVAEAAPAEAAPWEPTPEPEVPAEPQEPVVDVPQLRANLQKKIVELTTAGKKAAVKEIVTAYAAKVSAIPEDKLTEVLEKLAKLEG